MIVDIKLHAQQKPVELKNNFCKCCGANYSEKPNSSRIDFLCVSCAYLESYHFEYNWII